MDDKPSLSVKPGCRSARRWALPPFTPVPGDRRKTGDRLCELDLLWARRRRRLRLREWLLERRLVLRTFCCSYKVASGTAAILSPRLG